jgi:hypothetical protein
MQMFYGRQIVNLDLGWKNFDRDLLLGACFSRSFYPIFAAGHTAIGCLVCGFSSCFVPLGIKLLKLFWFV